MLMVPFIKCCAYDLKIELGSSGYAAVKAVVRNIFLEHQ